MAANTLLHEAYHFISNLGGSISSTHLQAALTSYEKLHTTHGGDEETRRLNYASMANIYYDLVTAFYEYAWGQSFHFAHRLHGESFRESIKRHEHYIALRLGLKPGMKVLDVGCGIGGPLREIAAFSGASITGLNNNEYQIKRGTELNEQFGLGKACNFLKADFMKIPVSDNMYDAIYTIEACCHAPDLVALHKELKRVLKPGQLLAGLDWCMTKAYDPEFLQHKSIKAEIELGNGLPDIRTTDQCLDALKDAGFEVVMEGDLAETSQVPWYEPLNPRRLSINGFRTTGLGRFVGRKLLWMLERSQVVPKGSLEVSHLLERSGNGLVAGGKLKIFTPMYFFLVRKPIES